MKGTINKYFIAIVPPEPILSEVRQFKEDVFSLTKSKGALRSPAHITLHMPFEWAENKEQRLIDTLTEFTCEESAIKVCLADFKVFEPRVVFINVTENKMLVQLEKQLCDFVSKNLQLFNQRDSLRAFHPHITIAFRDLNKKKFYEVWEKYKHLNFSAEFISSSFCLLKSDGNAWQVHHEFSLNNKLSVVHE